MHDRVFKIFRKYHNYHNDMYPIITSGYGATEFGSLVYECGHFSPANKKINTVGKKVINESVQTKIGWFQNFFQKNHIFFQDNIEFLRTPCSGHRFSARMTSALNPHLLHFGNIQERHFWKKI